MKGQLNPELKVGDKIVLYHMEGETSVPPGTKGTVTGVSRDPFETQDEKLINVKWENGSSLAIVSSTDAWKLAPKENIKEDREFEYINKNPEILEYFDWRFLREFLYKLRDSGIVNMLGSAPLLYSGKEHIDRYYGEGREDDEKFQAVLENADESKNKIIQGVIDYMHAKNKDLDDMDMVNRYARNFSQKIVGLYITLSPYRKGND